MHARAWGAGITLNNARNDDHEKKYERYEEKDISKPPHVHNGKAVLVQICCDGLRHQFGLVVLGVRPDRKARQRHLGQHGHQDRNGKK